MQEQTSYWKGRTCGGPHQAGIAPPTSRSPAVQSFRAQQRETFELPKDLLKQLKDVSQQEQATLFMTLGASFMALLHRYTGQDDILGWHSDSRTGVSGNPKARSMAISTPSFCAHSLLSI